MYSLVRTRTHRLIILLALLGIGCAGNQAAVKERAAALENLGISYVRQGDLRTGLGKLLEAEDLDPDDADIQQALALVYRDLEQYQLSLEHFKKALFLRPKFPEAQNNLGTLYLLMKKWDLAIESFQKAVTDILYKTPHFAYNNLGLAYFNTGKYEKAIESYRQALKLEPQYGPSYMGLAYTYETIHQWKEAIQAYERAINYYPSDPIPYYRLGKIYHRLNRKAQAKETLMLFLGFVSEGPAAEEVRQLLKKN